MGKKCKAQDCENEISHRKWYCSQDCYRVDSLLSPDSGHYRHKTKADIEREHRNDMGRFIIGSPFRTTEIVQPQTV